MRYRLADLVFDSSHPLPELAEAAGTPEVTVRWRDAICTEGTRWFHAWPSPEGNDWVRFGRRAGSFVLEFPGRARFVIAEDGAHVELAPVTPVAEDTLRQLLMHQVLPLVLSRRGRVVVHASAVSIDGGVVAFVGPTDAGKSTLAAACCRAGATHVTDDALVLVEADDGSHWRAVPSYAGLRLWSASAQLLGWPSPAEAARQVPKLRFGPENCRIQFETARLPLKRVIVLAPARGSVAASEPLRGHRAVLSVATHLFRLDVEDASETVRLFDAVARIAPAVDVQRFESERPTEDASLILPTLFPPVE
jgi:hypothetical protein